MEYMILQNKEVCFNIYLLKVESLSMLIKKILFQRDESPSMICDITSSLEVHPGPIFNLLKCDVET